MELLMQVKLMLLELISFKQFFLSYLSIVFQLKLHKLFGMREY